MADPALVDAIAAAIKQHESGGNYTWTQNNNGAHGAYQFIPSTWQSLCAEFGLNPDDYSPQNQDEVAKRYIASILDSNNTSDPGVVASTWYVGHPVADGSAEANSVPYPSAGNTITVEAYMNDIRSKVSGGSYDNSQTGADQVSATDNGTIVAPWLSGIFKTAFGSTPGEYLIRFAEIIFGGMLIGAGFIIYLKTMAGGPTRGAMNAAGGTASLAKSGAKKVAMAMVAL